MKQTLFEAEAVLSANTAGMLADIDAAVAAAKAKMQSLNGSWNIGGGGGGRGGGGGGGGSSNKAWNDYFKVEMAMARGEKAAGQYGNAINRLTALAKSNQNSALQAAQAWNALGAAQRAAAKAASGPGGRGGRGPGNDYEQQKILAQTAKAAGDYAGSLAILDKMSKNTTYSQTQLLKVQKEIVSVRNQANRAQQAYDLKGEKAQSQAGAQAAQALKKQTNETKQLINAQVRAAMSVGEFNRAVQIQSQYLGTLKKDTTEYYNALAKLNHLKNIGAQAGDPKARQRNAMVQNLSFGIQDFAVVASMGGGMGRAFAAASNNLAFMVSMMGTTQGAVLGLGLTLGAIALPAITRFTLGLHSMGERAEEASLKLDRMANRMKRLNDLASQMQKIGKMQANTMEHATDAQGLRDMQTNLKDELELTVSDDPRKSTRMKEAEDFQVDARTRAADDFMWSVGTFAKNIPEDLLREIRGGTLTVDKAKEYRDKMPWDVKLMIGDQWQELIARLEAADAPLNDVKEQFKALEEQLKAVNAAVEAQIKFQQQANAALGERHFNATNRSEDWVLEAQTRDRRAAEALEKKKKLAPMQLSATEGLFEQFFPKAAAKRKIEQQYAEAMYGMTDPTEIAQMNSMKAFQLAEVDKQGREKIVGTMGGSDFASQLTNALLKSDPQEKLHQEALKQTGFQQALVTKMDMLIDVNKTDITTPFANN